MLEQAKLHPKIQLTKKSIHQALIQLLYEKKLNKITIKELCQTAGINRTTFYTHYGSQYDVLNEMADFYLQSTSYTIINDLHYGKKVDESLTKVLEFIKDNLEFIKLLLTQDHYDLLDHIANSLPNFDQMILRHLPEQLDLEAKQAIASYVQYGTVRLLKEWILSNCHKTPEEEAKLILFIAGRTIGSLEDDKNGGIHHEQNSDHR